MSNQEQRAGSIPQPTLSSVAVPVMKGKPTPTPWSIGRTSIFGESLLLIGEQNSFASRSVQLSTADAAFIVLACNNHEALLAAAEAAVEVWSVDPTHLPPGDLIEHYSRLVKSIANLKAAVAKALEELAK